MKKFISIILVASTPILLSGMLSVAHAQQTPSGSAPPQQPTAPGTTGMSPGDQMQQAQQQNAEEQKMQEQALFNLPYREESPKLHSANLQLRKAPAQT